MTEQPESSSVRVKIYDREYAFRTTGDPKQLQALCANLDKRMRDAAESTGTIDTLKLAVLAALSLSDDLQRAKEETRKLDDAVARRALACISILDKML